MLLRFKVSIRVVRMKRGAYQEPCLFYELALQ